MAIFHLSVSSVKRSKGQSAVSSASYIEDITMRDERLQKTFRYGSDRTAKHKSTIRLGSFLPDGTPIDTAELWNLAEASEKRKDSQTARKIIAALPAELDKDAHMRIAKDYQSFLWTRYGVATTTA